MATINHIWDELSDNVLMETDENDAVIAQYTHEPQRFGKVLSQRRGGADHYYNYDAFHSTRQLTDEVEGVSDDCTYSAYGEEVASSGSTTNPFKYKGAAGYYTNSLTGDLYVRARTYGPVSGRWLSKDPLGFVDGPSFYRGYFVPGGMDPSGQSIRSDFWEWLKTLVGIGNSTIDPSPVGPLDASELLSGYIDGYQGAVSEFTKGACRNWYRQAMRILKQAKAGDCSECAKIGVNIEGGSDSYAGKCLERITQVSGGKTPVISDFSKFSLKLALLCSQLCYCVPPKEKVAIPNRYHERVHRRPRKK